VKRALSLNANDKLNLDRSGITVFAGMEKEAVGYFREKNLQALHQVLQHLFI